MGLGLGRGLGFGLACSIAATTAPLLTSSPLSRMRSRKVCRCGEVKRPTRAPLARRMASHSADVVPFPFVPAMCTTFSFWNG